MQPKRTIAESNNFIILDEHTRIEQPSGAYQSEHELEQELIKDLQSQGYEYRPDITSHEALINNLREQIERLNDYRFSKDEWERFQLEYLNRPSDGVTECSYKIHNGDAVHDFRLDDDSIKNIRLLDKSRLHNNRVQVINQFGQKGSYQNYYDVTILVNGLPLVHIELKRRGVAIREAFNQVHRYHRESFNAESSLFKYLQVFAISNGTDTRYFANTTKRDKNSFDFTMNWARADNTPIKDLKDFTATFFDKTTLLSILIRYSVFDTNNILLIMRPYQIAATERILWKIKSSYENKQWSTPEGGGYIWHTTGSGKTLTSFKAARLATQLDFIDKVFFVVDRKDLDYQTMKEYQRFSPDSVNGSQDTRGLKENIKKDDNKIIVTTIQKLNNLLKSEDKLPIYNEHVVFIFDEAHRSQFGEAQRNLQRRFKKYYQFGFTGTPIFPENALGAETTASVFGQELHSYVITDAIRDEKVLKFKVDYNNVRPKFAKEENEQDEEKLTSKKVNQALLHPERIREVSQYILDNYRQKTHRRTPTQKGFNALFAVSSVDAAKLYYETFKELQKGKENPLTVATIFSFAANEEQDAIGDIPDESFTPNALTSTAKDFLAYAIEGYNSQFGTSFGLESKSFENYYRDLAKRTRDGEVDLLIVVGMFLTGFDAPRLNTMFVDKNLRHHGLIQAFSRTNRIYDATKTFGNIVCFRNLEEATKNAIILFGDKNTKNVVLEKSYEEYIKGFMDGETGKAQKGYKQVIDSLKEKFSRPDSIEKESDKKAFVQLFGEFLRLENILQNYDEYAALEDYQSLDKDDPVAVQAFKEKHYLNDEQLENLVSTPYLPARVIQDYKSTYNDIREWLRRQRSGEGGGAGEGEGEQVNWDDITFEVQLLKSQEINLDYILHLIFEQNTKHKDKATLIAEIRRMIRSSVGHRAKEDLIVRFIEQANLDDMKVPKDVVEEFFKYARKEQKQEAQELIRSEGLEENAARRYISQSLRREYADDVGTGLDDTLPKRSLIVGDPQEHLQKRKTVFERVSAFVEKFKGIGGKI